MMRIFPHQELYYLSIRSEVRGLISRIPVRRAVVLGILLGWILLSTVVPVPAPPGGDGGSTGPT